ncbi:MAG: cytochrome b/b6 domain-containing protein [Ketobacteraceae bacterium]|nr:cytochrome b/b6 domain-containing protein [Ketobacteraceae bacterium]
MKRMYVWDRFVRVFHWTLVVLFCTSYLTGDEVEWLHVYSGYSIALLILARTVWGFVGTSHARFKDFLYSPRDAVGYLKSLANGNPRHYLGHNPAGAMMVFALLIGLFLTTLSGMKLYAVEEGKGPLAQQIQLVDSAYADADEDEHEHRETEGEDFWEEVHEFAVNFMVLLVMIHILGVVISSRAHHEALIKAMITGYKEHRGPD